MVARKVLIAVDESPQSKHAFEWYFENWWDKEDQVIVAHCFEHHHHYFKDTTEIEEARIKTDYTEELGKKQCNGNFVCIRGGKAGEALVDLAEREKVDCVVLGTRGSGTLRRTIMGSTSDYVVHHAHCPVLVCRE